MNARAQIGLGCVTFGREIDEATSFALLDHALARGVRHFDTAAAYGGGASETILGNWIASRRPQGIIVATKVLPPYDRIDVSGSLRRLGAERLDILYLHQWHESARNAGPALNELLSSGVVRHLGVSNFTLSQLGAIEARVSCLQNNHNLAVSDLSEELKTYCSANNVAVVSFSPLGAGFLTGKHQKGVLPGSRFEIIPGHQQVYFHATAYERLARLEAVARRTGYSQTHLALAWALHQPGIDTVLVGGRCLEHLDQAFAALEFEDEAVLAELAS